MGVRGPDDHERRFERGRMAFGGSGNLRLEDENGEVRRPATVG